ncbi:glycosyltransferase [Acidipila sp. 4G-K13]|nr:glycosyltransferase [Paracidobacterium acidisoli]
MLLVLPVPFRQIDGNLYFEEQACNGLNRWSDSFAHVVVAAPVIPEHLAAGNTSVLWKPVSEIASRNSLTFVPLPWAYGLRAFTGQYRATRELLRERISKSGYLQFAIGGLVGDWAAVACLEAIRQKRRFAIHTDRVEHEVLLEVTKNASFPRRMKARLIAALMKPYHRYLIRRCSLGLWHGSDCYHVYSPWCRENHLIHDVHTRPEDGIDQTTLEAKLATVETAEKIRLCYAGRLDPMKAPLDWLKAVAVARDAGAPVEAVWFGEGSLREEAEAEVERLKLGDIVSLPGFLRDRAQLLARLRAAHMMAFTHVTPESPRCLLESLISGTPIVGYENKFATDLTLGHGGGSFVAIHDWEGLGRRIAELASDRKTLRELIREAATNGRRFNDAAVFAERSELIRRFC